MSADKISIVCFLLLYQAKVVFPTVTSVLSALEQCFHSGRQSERHALCAAELALAVLRTDPVNAPALESLINTANSVLVTLHRAAVSLLREVFLQHSAHHKGLLVELMAQLSQCYTVKTPYRSYPLSADASNALTSGERAKYASMTVVALLSCLQSTVSPQESLTLVKKSKHKTTSAVAADPTITTENSSKGKGKKTKAIATEAISTSTDITTNSTALNQHTAENAKKSVIPAYVCCSGFAADLFQVSIIPSFFLSFLCW